MKILPEVLIVFGFFVLALCVLNGQWFGVLLWMLGAVFALLIDRRADTPRR